MTEDNIILPFSIHNAQVRGRVIRLDSQLDVILKQHAYPEEIARILGKILLVAAMLGSQFKSDAILTIQLRSKGRLKDIIVDYQTPGHIRGYAQFDKDGEFINEALLSITVDHNGQRYQGVVEVNDMNISEAVEKYFDQSEQINSALKLAVWNVSGSWCSGGIMIQKLPEEKDEDDVWEESKTYFATIKDAELIDPNLSLEKFLYNVYHEAGVNVYEPIAITHKCRCSHERAAQIIKTLGHDEAVSLLIEGILSVNCQFCNVSQNFSKDEIEKIYSTN